MQQESPSFTPLFPVVGIVGSAGSRQALEMFLRNLPVDSGMAFVVMVTSGRSQMNGLSTLLQKRTHLPVVAVVDDVLLEADQIYVAPAGVQLLLEGECLKVEATSGKVAKGAISGVHDTFLTALADTYGGDALAVLLSGTGKDGIAGLQRLKQQGGLIFIQDPEEAAHAALPRRAVAACPDAVVATAGELARQLVQAKGDLADPVTIREPESIDTFATHYATIIDHVARHIGHDLSHYKMSTLYRRIARRMGMANIPELAQYVEKLRTDPVESGTLFRDLLVSVTSFFRDPDAYGMLERDCIPQLFAEKSGSDYVRVWIAGCATGQEAYSVAMQLVEYAAQVGEPPRLQVFATDLDEEAIAFARQGVYPLSVAEEMTSERLGRFFIKDSNGYRVKPEIREHVLFAVHDLLKDPPFSRLDLVTCRNVLIYFNREAQEKIFGILHYALNDSGYLFLGSSESADAAPDLFAVLDKYCHLYQRRAVALSSTRRLPTATLAALEGRSLVRPNSTDIVPTRTLEELYTTWSLRVHTPPRLLVNANYEITHLFGEVSRYLRDPEGPVTQNILQRVLPELRLDLRSALYQAFNQQERSVSRGLRVELKDDVHLVHLHVGPVREAGFPAGYVEVVFVAQAGADVLALANTGEAIETDLALVMRMEEELMRTRERLQTIIEEYEDSSQELKTSNEELQSINEELKSTTEELETSKEELQSMNEELVTVNTELTDKIEELNRVNSDLSNLIASTDVGVIFLDKTLRISRFTPRATDLFNLIDADRGRPIAHVTHRIRHTGVAALAAHVQERAERVEETVQDENDRWYILRLFPYRANQGESGGVVITFVDISDLKRAESEERQRRQQQTLAALSRQAMADDDLNLLLAETTRCVAQVLGMEFCKVLELQAEQGVLLLRAGVGWQAGAVGTATVPANMQSQAGYTLQAQSPVVVRDLRTESRFQAPALLTEHGVRSGMSVTINGPQGPYGVLGVHSQQVRSFATYDVDFLQAVANTLAAAIGRQQMVAELRTREAALRRYVNMIQSSYDAIIVWSVTHGIEFWNRGAEELYGYLASEALGHATHQLLATIHPQPLSQIMQALMERGEWEGEITHTTKDGRTIIVSTRHQLMQDNAGDLVILEINRDITESKSIEAELHSAHKTLALTQRVSQSGVWDWDIAHSQNFWSPEYYELYGFDPATEPSHARWLAALHPDDRARIEQRLREVFAQHGDWNEEFRIIHPTRGERWLLGIGKVHYDEHDEPVRFTGINLDITERKVAEAQLRYQAYLLENVHDAVISTDLDFRIRTWNRGAEQLYGWSASEAVGKLARDLLTTDYLDVDSNVVAQTFLTEGRWQGEVVQLHKNGTPLTISNMTILLRDEAGNPTGAVAVNRDVTAQRAAETALRSSEERFRAVQQVTPDGFMIFESVRDESGTIVDFRWLYTNSAGERIVGRSHADLVGKQLLEEMPGNRTDGLFAAYVGVVESGEVWFREFRYQHEGFDHWFRTTAARAGDGIAVVFSDITEHKAVEAALAESEERFRTTFEQAAVGMAHTDQDGRYLQVNDRLCAVLGYTRAELLTMKFADLVHPEDRARSMALNDQLVAGAIPSYTMEKRYIRHDGSVIWINLTVSAVRASNGDFRYRLAVIEDISARKAAEAKLQDLNATLESRIAARTAELERSNRDLDEFAYIASHDLRAPLRAIEHLAAWIAEDAAAKLPAASQEHLQKLRGRVHRMELLLEDLLVYSRAGRIRDDAVAIDLGELVDNVAALMTPPSGFEIIHAAEMPTITTYRAPLELVLRNLIGNAIKHHHQPSGRVQIEAVIQNEFIKFTVTDDGPGIAPEYQARIFGMFQTLRPRDEVEGSGIGLAVVKKTVESMGGEVWVESVPGQGATFHFTWPRTL
ncbi:MAG: PAS domain S-box protein [Caldilineaceae bacterium]